MTSATASRWSARRRGACRNWWETADLTPVGNRALRDADMAKLGNYLTQVYDFGACAMAASRAAIHAEADDHIFDELKDWIDALPDWDGVARLDGWLATYAGADTEAHAAEYLALVGSKYIMQALNRALHPGAKADYSLVFTALQGIGKDRVLEAMFAPYYREGIPSPRVNPADFARGIAGAIVAHGAEMSAWRKVRRRGAEGDADALRRPWPAGLWLRRRAPIRGAPASPSPLNDVEFLQDATGNRRYWPVSRDPRPDRHRGLRRDRDQTSGGGAARG